MAKTITQILSWVDSVVANKSATSDKVVWLSDLLGDGDFRKYNTKFVTSSTYKTSTASALYDLPAGVRIQDLYYVGVSGTTFNSSNVMGTTTPFTEYKYAGIRDARGGNVYWDESTQIAFARKTTDVYHMKYIYKPYYGGYTASSDSTTIIEADSPLINWLQYKLAACVCKFAAFPRIDLANNYELDAAGELANAKTNYYSWKIKTSRNQVSWKAWW